MPAGQLMQRGAITARPRRSAAIPLNNAVGLKRPESTPKDMVSKRRPNGECLKRAHGEEQDRRDDGGDESQVLHLGSPILWIIRYRTATAFRNASVSA